MADLLSLTLLGDRNLIRNLETMPDTVRAILLEKTRILTEDLARRVEENIETRLNKNKNEKAYSGSPKHMKDAVETFVDDDGNRVEGTVYIDNIPYARAQEKGANIPAHVIYPRRAKVLAFIAASGDKVVASRVFHPGAVIPPSRFMADAYREMGPIISKEIKKAVVQGIRAQMRSGR